MEKVSIRNFLLWPFKLYKAGPNRKVEGRNGMVWTEEDWVDEMAVEHRDPDE